MLRMTRPGHPPPIRSKSNSNRTRDIDPRDQTMLNIDSNPDIRLNNSNATTNITHGNNGLHSGQSNHGIRSNNGNHSNVESAQYNALCMSPLPQEEHDSLQMTSYPGQKELRGILKELRFLTDKVKDDDEFQVACGDWKFAAMVIDRMCMIVFTLFTVVSTVAILFSAPSMWT